jgi:hypothetical protein
MATRIDYAAVLADLEARRDAIDAAIAAIKALPQPDGPAPKPVIGRPRKSNLSEVKIVPLAKGPRPGDLDYDDSAHPTQSQNEFNYVTTTEV